MNDKRQLLRHFLAALAYRTRKVLRDAPDAFASFDAGHGTRTPLALVRHMSDVLNHARTFFGGPPCLEPLSSFEDEVARFFEIVGDLGDDLSIRRREGWIFGREHSILPSRISRSRQTE